MEDFSLTSEQIRNLYDSGRNSDVTFIVGHNANCVKFKAHSSVLKGHESLFKEMFNDKMYVKENNPKEICIMELEERGFENLLRHAYHHDVKLSSCPTALKTLVTADKFECYSLCEICLNYLLTCLNMENVLVSYDILLRIFPDVQCTNDSCPSAPSKKHISIPKELSDLAIAVIKKCEAIICDNSKILLSSDSFEEISFNSMMSVVKMDRLNCDESLVFNSVVEWAKRCAKRCNLNDSVDQLRHLLGPALFMVRYLTMSIEDFENGPANSALLTPAEKHFMLCFLQKSNNAVVPDSIVPFLGYLQRPRRRIERKKSRKKKKRKEFSGDRINRKKKDVALDFIFLGLEFLFG